MVVVLVCDSGLQCNHRLQPADLFLCLLCHCVDAARHRAVLGRAVTHVCTVWCAVHFLYAAHLRPRPR